MFGDQFGHLKHVDRALTAENCLKACISINIAPVRRILQVVLLNIFPQLFCRFGARKRRRPYYFRKLCTWLQRFHKGWVWLSGHYSVPPQLKLNWLSHRYDIQCWVALYQIHRNNT